MHPTLGVIGNLNFDVIESAECHPVLVLVTTCVVPITTCAFVFDQKIDVAWTALALVLLTRGRREPVRMAHEKQDGGFIAAIVKNVANCEERARRWILSCYRMGSLRSSVKK